MYILYLIAGIFLIIGIGIRFFKWYFLISGYNTMSKEKKENVDIEKLGKLMGNFSIIIGILFIIAAIAQNQGNGLLTSISLFSIFTLTVILIIYAQKYDKNRANNVNSSPYIVIKTEDKSYIINYKDSNKTMELYNELKVMDS